MVKINQVYKCEMCANIVEILQGDMDQLECCGRSMVLMQEKTEDQGNEKHVPVIEKTDNGVKVTVGSVPHPMEEAHWINWIEIIADGKVYRQALKPGDAPEAEFCVTANTITAREYCNLHGLWKSR